MAEIPDGTRTEDRDPFPAAAPSNGSYLSAPSPQPADETGRLRGVVAFPHPREVLFTDEVALAIDQLPRWQPQLIVDERCLLDDDDE